MDAREERLVKNETLFREVNERTEEKARAHGGDDHVYTFLCECSNLDCTLRLELRIAEYEAARSDPAVFLVAPGHELPEIEDVIHRAEGFQLVRKRGEAGVLAAERDPRS